MKTIRHTKASLALFYFADLHAGWHTFKTDAKTRQAVERCLYLRCIEVNEHGQFRAIYSPASLSPIK